MTRRDTELASAAPISSNDMRVADSTNLQRFETISAEPSSYVVEDGVIPLMIG